ncbi:7-carboxy-7-deazaguanine synthase QueE [Marivirga atlantica]|jgi:organic radical activating enzyme|uniref:7-carboxy-7-deazaguanine synthase n=1 Tax=Marivirga atlantica TaxID=1548457 RepID=A0A937AJR1_9BACT|nr:7-carboxy-7-deazaguanine synthase QueE [Marivirga atlantica]MBL0766764.1 7-carboxy-7-deazaguanine synthase QueE [Marivirga atlantica]
MDKTSFDHTKELPLMEAFYTIQGEGAYSGKAAYFIRLGGCDVGCVWCDVKDSWDADKWPLRSVQEIVDEAGNYQSKLVVVTGGEPFMYNLDGLTSELKAKGFHINVETSGAHPFSGTVDWVCLSPKKFKAPMSEWYEMADELKIIIFNESDFKWAEQHAALVDDKCKLLLQPEWSKQEKMTPYIIEYVKQHPKWSISLQTHKYLDIP